MSLNSTQVWGGFQSQLKRRWFHFLFCSKNYAEQARTPGHNTATLITWSGRGKGKMANEIPDGFFLHSGFSNVSVSLVCKSGEKSSSGSWACVLSISTVCSIKHFYSVQYICVFKYIFIIYICRETSTNKSLSPWEPRTPTKGKEGVHALKSRTYGNIFPFPPGSRQQRERDGHCKLLKQERTCVGAGSRVKVAGMGSVGQSRKVKHTVWFSIKINRSLQRREQNWLTCSWPSVCQALAWRPHTWASTTNSTCGAYERNWKWPLSEERKR